MQTQHEQEPVTTTRYSSPGVEPDTLATLQDQETEQRTEQENLQHTRSSLQAQAAIIKLKRQGRVMWRLNVLATCLMIPMIAEALYYFDLRFLANPYLLALCFGIIGGLLFIPWLVQRQTEQSLMQIDDIRLIGPLAEALDAEVALKPKAIIAALRRLLPRLQASDASLLNREQRACLYRALRWRVERAQSFYDRGLARDILKALEQIGDKDALPHVQYVAKWSQDKALRDAANNCLAFLHQKAEEYRRSETYLRPSSATAGTPDILLRPASGTAASTISPEQLLRPDQQDRTL